MLVALGESYEKLERMQQAKKVSSAQRGHDFEKKNTLKRSYISFEFLDVHWRFHFIKLTVEIM